jgi:flagellar hook-associated protein 3
MRITNNMVNDLVTFNLQRSLSRFMDMQTQMSSGRRLNRPSDDPLGVLQDLDYRSELDKNAQLRDNISQGQNWMQTYDSVVSDLTGLLSEAKEVAVTMSNGTYDSIAREASANEVESILDQLMQLSQAELEGKKMFSGFRTDDLALTATADGVVYRGDNGIIEFPVEPSARIGINIIGSELFLKKLSTLGEKADLNPALSNATLLADLHGGSGADLTPGTIQITDENLGITVNVDLSAAVTVGDAITAVNNALAANVPPINNLTLTLGQQRHNLFFETTENGLISTATPLDNLNGGSGVDLTTGRILLTNGAALNLEIDLRGSTTINDIITKFNAAVLADPLIDNVTMQVNAAGTGLEVIDSNGVPLGLSITEISPNANTAGSLGIVGSLSPNLVGRDLDPLVDFKVEENGGTTAADLGIKGKFRGDFTGSDLDPALVAIATLSDLNGGRGFSRGQVIMRQGDTSRTIDLSDATIVTVQDLLDTINTCGLNITASINAAGTGIQIVNNDPTRSFIIQEVNNGRTAKDFGIFGSSDMVGSLMVLTDSLRADDQEGISLLLENLDDSIQHSLNHRAAVGAKAMRMESSQSRLQDMDLSFTKLLSEVEDADISKLVTDLASYENNYRASLIASAKIVQPSLLDFLD